MTQKQLDGFDENLAAASLSDREKQFLRDLSDKIAEKVVERMPTDVMFGVSLVSDSLIAHCADRWRGMVYLSVEGPVDFTIPMFSIWATDESSPLSLMAFYVSSETEVFVVSDFNYDRFGGAAMDELIDACIGVPVMMLTGMSLGMTMALKELGNAFSSSEKIAALADALDGDGEIDAKLIREILDATED